MPIKSKIFLSPRAFNKLYNIELIAEAFIELSKRIEDSYFVFIGRQSDNCYAEKIQSILKKDLKFNYRWVGEVPNEKVKFYYRAADIVYSFASREGFPNTVLETFASETNLICGEIDNLRNSFLKDNENVTFSKFKVYDIVRKTFYILNDSINAERQKANALKSILKNSEIEKNAERMVLMLGDCPAKKKTFPIILLCYDLTYAIMRKLVWRGRITVQNHY